MCAEEGRTTVATLVDHIVPLDAGGTHETPNLQSLCRPCHARKTLAEHPREDGGGMSGRETKGGGGRGGRISVGWSAKTGRVLCTHEIE